MKCRRNTAPSEDRVPGIRPVAQDRIRLLRRLTPRTAFALTNKNSMILSRAASLALTQLPPRSCYLATLGQHSRQLTIYDINEAQLTVKRNFSIDKVLGVPTSVALTREFAYVLTAAEDRNYLTRYRIGPSEHTSTSVQTLPTRASSVAVETDGTVWIGRSFGQVERITDVKPDSRDAMNSFPSRLVLDSRGKLALLAWRVSLTNSSIPQILTVNLSRKSDSTFPPRDEPWSDFGFIAESQTAWTLNGADKLTLLRINARGTISRPRSYPLGSFAAEVGVSLGGPRFLLASVDGIVREATTKNNGEVILGPPTSTDLSLDRAGRFYYSPRTGAILIGQNGIARLRPACEGRWRLLGRRPLDEPVIVDFRVPTNSQEGSRAGGQSPRQLDHRRMLWWWRVSASPAQRPPSGS